MGVLIQILSPTVLGVSVVGRIGFGTIDIEISRSFSRDGCTKCLMIGANHSSCVHKYGNGTMKDDWATSHDDF